MKEAEFLSGLHPFYLWLKIQAALRLMAPFVAIVRLLIASLHAGATIALIFTVAAVTFALLMTILNVGTIARPSL
jgi:hypothetical protein